jgi:hypothetical protein
MRNFSEVIPGQEFLDTLAGILLVAGAGIALIWLVGMANWSTLLGQTLRENGEGARLIVSLVVRTPQQVLRNHVSTPNFALELDSVLPKVQE